MSDEDRPQPNPEHLAKLQEGVEAWNAWRIDNPGIWPDLRGADLEGAHLQWADLRYANLEGAKLAEVALAGADLGWANLRGAKLGGARLQKSGDMLVNYASDHGGDH